MLKILEPVFVTSDWPRDMRIHSLPFNKPLPIYRLLPRPILAGSLNRASGALLFIVSIAAAAIRMQPRPPSADYPRRRFTSISNS
ncbi:hypothetical protein LCL97_20965 [Seohaeicola saemankumensis]|nr:hypothetical protein [Seohaeicola saemankumensis]MCA0873310.1 hypothetical protein [Seohaeicola saemankumensis]